MLSLSIADNYMFKKKKLLFVFGTRPEAIKMAPLIQECLKYPTIFDVKVAVTAQHRQMLDQVLELFNIIPDIDLDLMRDNQDLYSITSDILLKMKEVLLNVQPALVLVHGDTTTTMSVSLAAYYMKIDVAHIEAGLRTHNLYSPFPEEMNRQITSRIAKYHFAPTERAKFNLIQEGIVADNIFVTGNTVIDALLQVSEKSELMEIELDGYKISARRFVLITGHRRENFGEGFLNICNAIRILALQYSDVDFVYPVHLNPNVQKPVYEILKNIPNVYLIQPLDYLPFVYLMKYSYCILTDSGGIQEEAPSLAKPVLVMRNTTERPEAIHAGTVKLVGTSKTAIVEEVERLLIDKARYKAMSQAHNPYGDGLASQRIIDILKSFKP